MNEETPPRSIIVDSAQCWTASSLALGLFHVRKFREPLRKLRAVASALWALPEVYFKVEVMQAVRDVPRGHCASCGVGFAEFITCDDEEHCDWINEPERSPQFSFGNAHPNLNRVGQWSTGAVVPPAAPAANEWKTS